MDENKTVCHEKMRTLLVDDKELELAQRTNKLLEVNECEKQCCADCEQKKDCRKHACTFVFCPEKCGCYPITYKQYLKIFGSITLKEFTKDLMLRSLNTEMFKQVNKNKKNKS